tara:strand:- start:219 stop:584 length:366 start_codon:yes stop_codon:yes gene_type:complete
MVNDDQNESDSFDFKVDEKLRPSVERKLTGTTRIDSEISALPSPKNWGEKIAVFSLRLYRKLAPKNIRCRCVFDPSCSHYSELAIRQHGLINGVKLTLKRLSRCKPENGGVDFLHINQIKS